VGPGFLFLDPLAPRQPAAGALDLRHWPSVSGAGALGCCGSCPVRSDRHHAREALIWRQVPPRAGDQRVGVSCRRTHHVVHSSNTALPLLALLARLLDMGLEDAILVTITRTVEQKGGRREVADRDSSLGPLLFHALDDLLAPDWRGPARTVTLRAKPRAAREPAGHTAAALAAGTARHRAGRGASG
jgi:hypothetical protein